MYNRARDTLVEFEWDTKKELVNHRKHRVSFADAAEVLHDEIGVTITESIRGIEQRHITIGRDVSGRLLAVGWVRRGRRMRLISARSATAAERREYEG